MNQIPRELCERENYVQTMKLLAKDYGQSGRLRRFEKFVKMTKHANGENKENSKPKSKLSFNVSYQF